MKILFTGVDFTSRSGPNTFAGRLADRLVRKGHVLADPDDYDVALIFIAPSHQIDLRRARVLRLDGIWSKASEFFWRNREILSTYRVADGVIFQSDFNRQQVTKWWGSPKSHTVIRNGIDLKRMTDSLPGFWQLRQQYDTMFVCSANWHPQKRLRENVRYYLAQRQVNHPNSCLIILGSNPDHRIADPHVFYAGSLSHEECLKLFAVTDWMIHLAWGDHCPNSVIEALSQGTPVICAETGGTKELVGANGIVIPERELYDFTLKDYDNPPDLPDDFGGLASLQKIVVDPSNLDIDLVADRYIEYFENILSSHC
jgi:glycosyltransferase involved in cell wall biosynthesis